jgi:hypothetical protein
MAVMPPALAARMPTGASSATKQRAGATRNSAAASRKISGSGLLWRSARPQIRAANASSSVRSPLSGTARSMASAFFEDEAAARAQSRSARARTNRRASGKAVTPSAATIPSRHRCFASA